MKQFAEIISNLFPYWFIISMTLLFKNNRRNNINWSIAFYCMGDLCQIKKSTMGYRR